MLRRFALAACLSALAGMSLVSVSALAVEIDEELQALLQAKSAAERVSVLMLFDEQVGVDDTRTRLDQAPHFERRRMVLENLRAKAERNQAGARKFLTDPVHGKNVGRVQTLYLANALAFEAAPEVVRAMGNLPDAATLFFDKTYDLTNGTTRDPLPAGPAAPAVTDTAWSVKYINAPSVWSDTRTTTGSAPPSRDMTNGKSNISGTSARFASPMTTKNVWVTIQLLGMTRSKL